MWSESSNLKFHDFELHPRNREDSKMTQGFRAGYNGTNYEEQESQIQEQDQAEGRGSPGGDEFDSAPLIYPEMHQTMQVNMAAGPPPNLILGHLVKQHGSTVTQGLADNNHNMNASVQASQQL